MWLICAVISESITAAPTLLVLTRALPSAALAKLVGQETVTLALVPFHLSYFPLLFLNFILQPYVLAQIITEGVTVIPRARLILVRSQHVVHALQDILALVLLDAQV